MWPESLYFPFTEPGLCTNTRFFFQRTPNGQLADCEEIFTEFDKKCIGLESLTAPFISFIEFDVSLSFHKKRLYKRLQPVETYTGVWCLAD